MPKHARLIYGSTYPEAEISNIDLLWRIGMKLPDPHFFIELGEEPNEGILLASSLEISRAEKEARNCRVEAIEPYIKEVKVFDGVLAVALFLKKHEVSLIEVHPETPAGVFERLRGRGFTVVVGKMPWYLGRISKREEEIGWMVLVQQAIEEALFAARERLANASIKDGVVVERGVPLTSEDMQKFIEYKLYLRGCVSIDTIVSSGRQAAFPHELGSGPLSANAPIIFDIFPRSRSTGYYADMTRTFFKGYPSAQAMWMYGIVLDAQCMGIESVYAGVDGKAIHQKITDFFTKKGFVTDLAKGKGFIHGTGHGIGLQYHEDPRINRNSDKLPQGAVVTVEPGLYYPEDELGIRIEDMVVVEENGCRNLTNFPKDLNSAIIA